MQSKVHNAGFLTLVDEAKGRIRQMNIEEYKTLVGSGEAHRLIDVREDNEWAAGHAARASHLGRGVLERDIESQVPDKAEMLVLYCGGGFRSALAVESLQKMGYQNAISLDGGWKAIEKSGLPLAR